MKEYIKKFETAILADGLREKWSGKQEWNNNRRNCGFL